MNDIEYYRQWNREFDSARKSMAETLANDCGEVLRAIHAGLRGELSSNPNDARLLGLCAGITDVLDRKAQQFEPVPESERTYYVQVKTPGRGSARTITYKSAFQIPVGSIVTLPPLPWMDRDWKATVIDTDYGDGYYGDIKEVIFAEIPPSK
jgi:hypothetical protein